MLSERKGLPHIASVLSLADKIPQLMLVIRKANKGPKAALVTTAMSVGGLVSILLLNVFFTYNQGQGWS